MLSPRCRLLPAVATAAAVSAIAHAQAFEAASIKPSDAWRAGEGTKRSRIEYSPNSVSMWNVGVNDCVQWAYSAKFYQIAESKAAGDERYDILAKAAGPVAVGQLRLMFQDLLAKRFQLVLHRESKAIPVYELTVAKRGPKLPAPKADAGVSPMHRAESLPRVENGSFVFRDTTLTEFAEKLSLLRGIEQPVLDKTGIEGVYDITLVSAASAILEKDGPSLFTLIEEQLGLKLVATKAPVEVLVIDHATRPAAN
jgi:uncharacterized protein (TIGR03435 family)